MGKNRSRKMVGVLLLVAAVVMLFLAWQCVTTVEYGLYQSNYGYYVQKAAECTQKVAEYQAQTEGTYGAQYALMAQNMAENAKNWQESAKTARSYLTAHRIGAGSLFIVSVLAIICAIRSFLPKKSKTKPEEGKNETQETTEMQNKQ